MVHIKKILKKKKKEKDTDTERRRPCEDGGREGWDASTSQGHQGALAATRGQERATDQVLP